MIGGARKGAGRKPRPDTKKRPISVKLPPWLIAWMRAQPTSQAVLIEEALIARYGLKQPKIIAVSVCLPSLDAAIVNDSLDGAGSKGVLTITENS